MSLKIHHLKNSIPEVQTKTQTCSDDCCDQDSQCFSPWRDEGGSSSGVVRRLFWLKRCHGTTGSCNRDGLPGVADNSGLL